MLFLQFSVNNYILGTKQNVPPASRTEVAKKAAQDAIHELESEIKQAIDEQTRYPDMEVPPEVKAKIDQAKSALKDLKVRLGDASKSSRAKAGMYQRLPESGNALPLSYYSSRYSS